MAPSTPITCTQRKQLSAFKNAEHDFKSPDIVIPEVILYLLFCFCFSRQIPSNHTFLVIRRRGASRADHVYRFNKAKALGLLEPVSPVRQLAISVVTNRYPFNNKI